MNNDIEQKNAVIHYGDFVINFVIEPRTTDIEKVLIKVYPDCRVIALSPLTVSYDETIIAVKKRARWIYRQLCYFESLKENILPRCYVSGESHFYLGRRHLLKVRVDEKSKPQVKLLRGVLEVMTPSANPQSTKSLLIDWYKKRAREIFSRRLEDVISKTLWVKEKPPIRLLSMQTQWGSCSSKGHITLNPHLVKAPKDCIDYVLLHELCHIAVHNHSKQFYRLMHDVMPQWEVIKERLDNMAYFYLNDV